MIEGVRALVLEGPGTNCHRETAHAIKLVGADADLAHIEQWEQDLVNLSDYNRLALSGGFADGDHIRSGIIKATQLVRSKGDQIERFLADGGRIVGICNGFQILVGSGLLPFGKIGEISAALYRNDIGHFKSGWTNLQANRKTPGQIHTQLPDLVHYMFAHGEGKFLPKTDEVLADIEDQNLVVFRYADALGNPTHLYPLNPNGSINEIAGIVDPTGQIIGLMPHPERYVHHTHFPNWRRIKENPPEPHGLAFFRGFVSHE